MEEKKLIINRYTVWTVPNILVFFRILCVPVFMTMVILSAQPAHPDWYVYIGLGIMALAAVTDVFDGKIARKYKKGTKFGKHIVKHDQATYVGQLIDPIADKTMHIGAMLALVIAGYLHWAFLALIAFREIAMVVGGTFFMNKVNVQSNMLGKVASAIISVGIIACFFHKLIVTYLWGVFSLDWIIVTIGVVLNWSAAICYLAGAAKDYKKVKEEKENAKEDSAPVESETSEENK